MWNYVKSAVLSFLYEEEFDFDNYEEFNPLEWMMANDTDQGPEETGVITQCKPKFCVIDDRYTFHRCISNEQFEVENRVAYTKLTTSDGRNKIIGVRLLPKEDEIWGDAVEIPLENVTVVSRNRRFLTFSNGVQCSLDSVALNDQFVPVEGDVLNITQVNNTYVVKIANKISGEGEVIEMVEGRGKVRDHSGKVVFFSGDVLEIGYEPFVGDRVYYSAIESKIDEGWRAISIAFQSQRRQESNPDEINHSGGISSAISLTGTCDFGEVVVNGPTKKIRLEVYNPNYTDAVLEKVVFRRDQKQIACETETPLKIKGASFTMIDFSCRAAFCGHNNVIVDFIFDECKISRRLEMIGVATEISTASANAIPHFLLKKNSTSFLPEHEQRPRIYGDLPRRKNCFAKQCQYAIPRNIQQAFTSADGTSPNLDIMECCPVLNEPLCPQNYLNKFHTLLFIEEMAEKVALSRLSRSHVFFRHSGDSLVLDIVGLAEQRPSLCVYDKVIVRQPWSERDNSEHVGIITQLTRDSIFVKFHDSFHSSYAETDCDVRFEVQRGVFNSMHNALVKSYTKLGVPVLFPTNIIVKESLINIKDHIVWHNKTLNAGQRLAVMSAVEAVCRPLPHVIFGPPGTGKTVTVVETILQVFRHDSNARIVVAAPSNSAADLLATRLIDGGKLLPGEIVRLLAMSRTQETIPEHLDPYCIKAFMDDEEETGNVSLGWHRITVGTCTSLATLHRLNLKMGHFTHVFIDEAGYATEPQLLIPLALLSAGTGVSVLAGDPKQLGPVLLSAIALKFGLGESFLVRLTDRFPYARDRQSFPTSQGFDPRLVSHLTFNYRSVPEILELPNKLFYDSELKSQIMGDTGREAEIIQAFFKIFPVRDTPASIMFHGVRGANMKEPDSPSWLNPHEMFEAIQYVRRVYSIGVAPSELAVITPYRKQGQKIGQMLTEFGMELPKIGSIEELQGQERHVIIMSCVRSQSILLDSDKCFGLGFVANSRRVNVAITRARSLLIILGNPHLLCRDTHWRSVIAYCVKQRAYLGCDLPECFDPSVALPNVSL